MSSRPSQSSELAARFPGLVELSGYVSSAWDYEYGTPEAAVEAFIDDCPGARESAAEGIDELLREAASEADRQLILDDFGFGYAGPPGSVDDLLIWASAKLRN